MYSYDMCIQRGTQRPSVRLRVTHVGGHDSQTLLHGPGSDALLKNAALDGNELWIGDRWPASGRDLFLSFELQPL